MKLNLTEQEGQQQTLFDTSIHIKQTRHITKSSSQKTTPNQENIKQLRIRTIHIRPQFHIRHPNLTKKWNLHKYKLKPRP